MTRKKKSTLWRTRSQRRRAEAITKASGDQTKDLDLEDEDNDGELGARMGHDYPTMSSSMPEDKEYTPE